MIGHLNRSAILFHPAVYWIVFASSLFITALAWKLTDNALMRHQEERFARQTDDIGKDIESRMLSYQAILRASAGFVQSRDKVSREEWKTLIASFRLADTLPGMQGIGYTRITVAGQAMLRSSKAPPPATSAEQSPQLSIIEYLEPLNSRNRLAIGFDQFANSERRNAMWQAMVSGEPALSGRVRLAVENGESAQHGILMFIPVYRGGMPIASESERRLAIQGFVFGVFRMGDLMSGILGQSALGLHFELHDGADATPETFLYQSDSSALTPAPHYENYTLNRELHLSIAGRPWLIRIHGGSEYTNREALVPAAVATAGLAINLLLFALVRQLNRSRHELVRGLAERDAAQVQLEVHQSHLEHLVDARTAELIAAEQRLHLILETTAEGIISCDAAGMIDYANAAAEDLLGFAPGELVGQPIRSLIKGGTSFSSDAPEDDIPVEASLSGCNDRKGLIDEFFCKDGTALPVSYTARKIVNHGQIQGCVLGFSDISDRKAADLARDQALDSAERMARFKSDFLANMSHEIRTPLNAVIASAMLMERDESLPKQRERLHRIVSSSQHLLRLINDILDFSKLEASGVILEQADFKLQAVFESVAAQLHEAIREKGLAWQMEIAPCIPPMLRGDAMRLGQVLLNLASNAVKFTQHGHVKIAAHLLYTQENVFDIRFEVHDTGPGFDPSKAEQLFESFAQEDASTTRRFGGTGLGLAISKQIVKLMGGRIGAESSPGAGSVFWMEVPLAGGERLAEKPRKTTQLRGKRAILLSKDGIAVSELKDQLAALGVGCQLATLAKELALRVETSARIGRPYEFIIVDDDDQNIAGFCDQDIQLRLRSPNLKQLPKFILCCDASGNPANRHAISRFFDTTLPKACDTQSLGEMLEDLSSEHLLEEKATQIVAASQPDLSRLRASRILLVEDNPINQSVAQDMLSSVGLSADIANDGREACVLAQNRQYDLILMDMQMPVMGGVEAAREIRRLPDYQDVPIIAMTANAFEVHRRECLDAGMNDFLHKPVIPAKLYAALQRWLPAKEASATGTEHAPHFQVAESSLISDAITAEAQLPDIPGVNVQAGLTRLSGRANAYLRLLHQLIELHGSDHELIRGHLLVGNIERAKRIAHSLKGSSAMLAADAVSAAALAIENGLDAGLDYDSMALHLANLAKALDDLGSGLDIATTPSC